ncbi:fumarate reductase subunit FrdD [Accumulibacter sp.]|uniref:fumarate reductase subunit FrdD n=1 Tax=Accumulibacter sp. TaxID=2053492 RepID=UPI0025F32276|nr:fumarate reductase subunit FrdD [Accumulibacter sp.]MCM8596743.1 fumarate reductase subunit FrdD [Accumulibacter sp.]MCM8624723.1 fumarate reductase subunit FrdD [Accumulibacter sp.]MDS4050892.1 fumarate reductase subunit FrdD [Accumulibacter sp.]
MKPTLKRSNAPIFWALFGAGGMLSALIGPMLVFITGLAVPLGLLLPADTMSYAHVLAFARNWAGKAFILAVIALFLWHAAHRIFHSLHDVGVHAGTGAKLVCYGLALVGTVIAAWALLAVGF